MTLGHRVGRGASLEVLAAEKDRRVHNLAALDECVLWIEEAIQQFQDASNNE